LEKRERKPVGIWIRVSTEDQAKGDSPQVHRINAKKYAALKNWDVVEIYDLSGVSGKTVMAHPETVRMLADIKSGHITGLIFSKLARLARNARELLELADIFQEHSADLMSIHESIDTSTPSGRMFFGIIASVAQFEREETVDRLRLSIATRAKMGKRLSGKTSFGYQWKGDTLVPHPDEAPVRALIFKLFAETQRKKTVARTLNERGYRTRNGSLFSVPTILRLLTNPDAKGMYRINHTAVDPKKGHHCLKPESEWVWMPCEAVVSVELWDQCNAILAKQAKGNKPGPRGQYLFAGKVKCGCGSKMYVLSKHNRRFVCRGCRNRLPQDDLEAIFRSQLETFFSSDDEIAAYLASTQADIIAKEEQVRVLRRERETLSEDRDMAWRGYNDGVIERDRFKDLEKRAASRLKEIDSGMAELGAEVAVLKVSSLSSEEVVSSAKGLYSRWEMLSFDEKASIINSITDDIVVGERDIAINLHYVPSTPDTGNKGTQRVGMVNDHEVSCPQHAAVKALAR
tara:strand:+ start:41947 stop:43491 length:1545 start_codon:yes stop_codon:yes gene_type:complete